MFDFSSLYALSKSRDQLSVYRINLDKETLCNIKRSFENGIPFFQSLEKHKFDPFYKLDQDECASIDNYDISEVIKNAIRNAASLPMITGEEFEEKQIKALFMGEVKNNNLEEKFIIVFKRIYKSNCLRKNFLNIMLNRDTYNSIYSSIISIPEINHILYIDGSLYFLSYKIASEILSLYSEYRSATNDEVDYFVKKISYDSVKYNFQDYAIKKIRKRIALILDSKILENYNEKYLSSEAKKQGLNLLFDENKKILFDLNDKKGTLLILDFLSENTFLSTFSKERNRTNSKEKI